jgi:Tenuivirus/Phlebovirus nucleocapsid protein
VSAQGTYTENAILHYLRHIFERPDPLSKWMDFDFHLDPLGFDVEVVCRKILTIGGDNYVEDVYSMVAFAVERSQNLEKIATDSSGNATSEIESLKSKYGLVTEATNPTSITLDRICLTFPMLTCKYMQVAREPVVDKEAFYAYVCNGYPLVMMHEAFGTLIPNSLSEECQRIIIDAHCLHQAHFAAIIGISRDGRWDKRPKDYIGSSS